MVTKTPCYLWPSYKIEPWVLMRWFWAFGIPFIHRREINSQRHSLSDLCFANATLSSLRGFLGLSSPNTYMLIKLTLSCMIFQTFHRRSVICTAYFMKKPEHHFTTRNYNVDNGKIEVLTWAINGLQRKRKVPLHIHLNNTTMR